MDVAEPAVTLVALADGTTSLYFGNGGGVIGAGEHEPVARARDSLIALAQQFDSKLTETTDFPLPSSGSVRFYLLTFSGVRTAEVSGVRHELMPLSQQADEVITAIRICHTKAKQKAGSRSKDNVIFVATIAACVALGAVAGAVMAAERLPGALGGGVVGMVVGLIAAGIVQIVSRAVKSRAS